MAKKSIVILISGSGTNLQAIIDAVEQGRINAGIAAVISNRADARGLQRARSAGIKAVVIDQKQYAGRASFDHALILQAMGYDDDAISARFPKHPGEPAWLDFYLDALKRRDGDFQRRLGRLPDFDS